MSKRNMLSQIRVGKPGLDMDGLHEKATKDPSGFMETIERLIEEKGYRMKDVSDLTGMFDALAGVKVTGYWEMPGGSHREIIADAFALFIGGLTIAQLVDDPPEAEYVGDMLVTEMNDPSDITIIGGVDTHDVDVDLVRETEEFPEIGGSDESFVIHSRKNGRRLTITGDMIRKNKVAQAVDKINKLEKIGRNLVEKLTIKRVIDLTGSGGTPAAPYVLEREGSKAAIYTTTANNPSVKTPSGTRLENTSLVDYTDLDAAREHVAGYRDDLDERIAIPASQAIVFAPEALGSTLMRILDSVDVPGVVGEKNPWGPDGVWRPKPVITPRLDTYSTSAWYYGDFKSQFIRKWAQAFTYVTLGDTTESYLQRDIAFQARISFDCEIGARGSNRVVQCLAGTTPPAES